MHFSTFDNENLETITDLFNQYSHTTRILKNKDTATFDELYATEFQEIKECKSALRDAEEADCQIRFIAYKDALLDAITRSIDAILTV